MRKKFLLEIAYDGTDFSGWQRQIQSNSIQQTLEDTFSSSYAAEIKFHSASRTDANVHACHLPVVTNLPPHPYLTQENAIVSLQRRLPSSIVILSCQEQPMNFSLDKSVKAKCYSYLFTRRQTAFNTRFSEKLSNLNLSAMQSAATLLIGLHNFSAFTITDGLDRDPFKIIYSIKWYDDGENVVLSIIGNAFLYKMVRIIVGTLQAVGSNKISIEQVKQMLTTGKRPSVIQTAPAKALFLSRSFLNDDSWQNFNTNIIPYNR